MRRLAALLLRQSAWLAAGLSLVMLAAFVELGEEAVDGDTRSRLMSADTWVLRSMARLRHPWVSGLTTDLTALGSPLVVALFTVALGGLLYAKCDRRGAWTIAVSSLASGLLTLATKSLLERPRPDVVPRLVDAAGLSFPSGHALASATVYLTASFVVARHLGRLRTRVIVLGLTGCLVVSIGASRVYLGVHYPSDVLGGILLGLAVALLLSGILVALDRRRGARARTVTRATCHGRRRQDRFERRARRNALAPGRSAAALRRRFSPS